MFALILPSEGHPHLDDDPAYRGHYANDGGGYLALEGAASSTGAELGLEKRIAEYVLESSDAANAMHGPFLGDGLPHVVTVATRDIKAGEEVLVTYGPDYWLDYGYG